MLKPTDEQRRLARRRAKEQRDRLLNKLAEAERRGDSERLEVIREGIAEADRDARGAA